MTIKKILTKVVTWKLLQYYFYYEKERRFISDDFCFVKSFRRLFWYSKAKEVNYVIFQVQNI